MFDYSGNRAYNDPADYWKSKEEKSKNMESNHDKYGFRRYEVAYFPGSNPMFALKIVNKDGEDYVWGAAFNSLDEAFDYIRKDFDKIESEPGHKELRAAIEDMNMDLEG